MGDFVLTSEVINKRFFSHNITAFFIIITCIILRGINLSELYLGLSFILGVVFVT